MFRVVCPEDGGGGAGAVNSYWNNISCVTAIVPDLETDGPGRVNLNGTIFRVSRRWRPTLKERVRGGGVVV